MTRVVVILTVLLGSVVLPVATAQACSCAVLSSQQQLKNADAVFVGTVVDRVRRGLGPADGPRAGPGTVVYRIEVDTVYKGEVSAVQHVVTNDNSAACGVSLPLGEPVIVFGTVAGPSEGNSSTARLFTHLCSGTGRGVSAPAEFGQGEPPIGVIQPAVEPTDASSDPATDWTVPGIIAVVVALLAGVVVFGKFRTRASPSSPEGKNL